MSDQASTEGGEPKRRTFSDALSELQPIVPLPGGPVREALPVAVPRVLPEADLPPATGPQAVPLPPAVPARIVPAPAAPVMAPVPRAFAIPAPASSPFAAPPPPVATAPAAAPELVIEQLPPLDSVARPDLAAGSAPIPGGRRLWPWAAVLAVAVAGGAVVWTQRLRAPQQPVAAEAPPPVAAEAPGPSVVQPFPAPDPVAVAPAAQPPAAQPPAEPPLEPTPALPDSPVPIPQAADPPRADNPVPEAAVPEAAVPEAATPEPPSLLQDGRVTLYYRPNSQSAGAEAGRLAAQLRPDVAQVDTRTAENTFRLPTIRYFHAADERGAQLLATSLRRPGTEWRIAGILTRRNRPAPGSFELWLPDR